MLRQSLASSRRQFASCLKLSQRRQASSCLLAQFRCSRNPTFSTYRQLSTTLPRRVETIPVTPAADTSSSRSDVKENDVYLGPLASTFRRLKIFSLSSLTLSFTLAPFMFLVETNLPVTARIALVGIALSTSGLSTALVSWCGKPYVTTLEYLKPQDGGGVEGLELTTLTLLLHPKITRVYDTDFLIETKRPFAKWELAETLVLPAARTVTPGEEETVAETLDKEGNVIGRWIVSWGENGAGTCREVGSINRYFNVHEELLR